MVMSGMNKVLKLAAWFVCVLSLCLAALSVWVGLLMWPGVLLQSVSGFAILSAAHLLSFFELWAVLKRRFVLTLALFVVAMAALLLVNLGHVDLGPAVCAWGPYDGLIDCGLPRAAKELP